MLETYDKYNEVEKALKEITPAYYLVKMKKSFNVSHLRRTVGFYEKAPQISHTNFKIVSEKYLAAFKRHVLSHSITK